jgi:hypothetical protein
LTAARLPARQDRVERERAHHTLCAAAWEERCEHEVVVADVAEHPIDDGRLYCGVVKDACRRRIEGR